MWWTWVLAGLGGVVLLLLIAYVARRVSRRGYYRSLAKSRAETIKGRDPALAGRSDLDRLHEEFEEHLIARVENFLDEASLERLRAESKESDSKMVRSYIPGHKKGATLSYERIHHTAPHCLAFYHSPEVQRFVSRVVGEKLGPTADHDQSSLSILCYDQEADHINWHFDHNFYKGRHFTVLLSLINRASAGGNSACHLLYKNDKGEEVTVDTSENVLVVFEGAKVLHKASKTADGDLRMMLSMTFATTPSIGWFKDTIRRFKDTAYYGLRVIWD
jgi:hypothetical protein